MIKPDRYTEPTTTVLSVAAELLYLLITCEVVAISDAESRIRKYLGEEALFNFVPAVSLLYILGRISYEPESDSLIYQTRKTA